MDHRIPRTPPEMTEPMSAARREALADRAAELPPSELPACAVCELPISPHESWLDLPRGAGKIHVETFDPETMVLTGRCVEEAKRRGAVPAAYHVPEGLRRVPPSTRPLENGEAIRETDIEATEAGSPTRMFRRPIPEEERMPLTVGELTGRDETEPHGPWQFDQEVTDAFEDMLSRSIPWYENMRAIVTDLASYFVPRGHAGGGVVVDLGASRGDGLQPIIDQVGAHARYHAVETSESMLGALRERWPEQHRLQGQEPYVHGVRIHDFDLRKGYPALPMASVTLCVLTLQFTPLEHRQRILRDIYRHTQPGGALILVEKVLGATAEIDELLVRRYYAMKGENGYSDEQIERKRLSLEGVLVPVTAAWNEELLRQAGFREVDCIWRWCNFAGWVAVRTD